MRKGKKCGMILSSAPGNRIGVVFVHHAGQSVFSTSVRRLFCLVLLYSMRQALSRGISDFLLDFGFSRGNYRVWPGASMSQGGLRSGVSRLIRAARGLPSSGRDFLRRGFPPPGVFLCRGFSFAGVFLCRQRDCCFCRKRVKRRVCRRAVGLFWKNPENQAANL